MSAESPTPQGLPASTTIRRASSGDLATLARIFGAAFDTDPVGNWFMRSDSKRKQAIGLMFGEIIRRVFIAHDECYLTTDATGATVWMPPPGQMTLSAWGRLAFLPTIVRVTGVRRLRRLLALAALTEEKHPKTPHFYLYAIGTLPEMHGRGIGSALIRAVLERCDREGIPAYLENSKERNLPFYEGHGFETTEQIMVPHGGPPMWLMWREPK